MSGGGSLKPKNCSGWQRYWCLLDGSSLLCYRDEEDEGVKQFETSLDFRGANVAIVSDKKRYEDSITNNFHIFLSLVIFLKLKLNQTKSFCLLQSTNLILCDG